MDTHDVSAVPQYMAQLLNQKKTLQNAQTRIGQNIEKRKSRDEITMQFRFRLLMGHRQRSDLRTSFIPPAYSPSFRSILDLHKVMIKDLLLETHHRGNYITVRSITPPDRMTAVMAIVEDENGDVVMLQLYYQEEENARPAEDLLGEGTVLIVKEPYLKLMSDGDYGLRMDHPSDLIYIPKNDQRIPSCWQPRVKELEVSAEHLRMQGNNYFNAFNYQAAIELYSRALKSTSEEGEAQTLKLNRSLALLKAKNFDTALADLEPMVSCLKPVEKALYRKAQALYNLQKFEECYEVLTALRSEYPDNVEAKKELLRATKRLQEQESGTYRFNQLYMEAAKLRPPHLDHATYIGSVAIRGSGIRGRGLFTTKAIKAGDLLFCEKSFAHAYIADDTQEASDRDNGLTLLINVERNTATMGAQSELIRMIFQKIYKSPSFAPAVINLHHGSYKSIGFCTVDSTPVIDTFYIERVIALNCFGCPLSSRQTHLRSIESEPVKKTAEKQFHSCGVWPLASHINHSCHSNARRAFIGDMMIVRATRDLAPNTEIEFWYHTPIAEENDDRQKKFEQWGFKCDCAMCHDDQTTKRNILNSRKQQRAKVLQHLKAGLKANLPEIEITIVSMEKQYTQLASKVPRLHVWDLHLGLAQVYMQRREPAKAINSALKSLLSLGYVIEGGNVPHKIGTPMVIKQWGLFEDHNIGCWGVLCGAYQLVAPELATQAAQYAKLSYRICVGEDETFEETYKLG
ncbi:TPR domain protein [Amylocarpus encephaloides]|uniref:TPR domain protein n=1 Tax=Amylocarpus encephaloides TaxID=45428 RepID=A0A9P7Y9Z6_9HELO|nr:TPR domain protein [Amylocarpus encephaloides]